MNARQRALALVLIQILESDPTKWEEDSREKRESLKKQGIRKWRTKLVETDGDHAVFSRKDADHLHVKGCKFADGGTGYTLDSAVLVLFPCRYCVESLRLEHVPRLEELIDR